ncbi:MAG: 2-oxoacid:acceptor oxidoreductase family protein [Candidatus Aenigmarchaeota archaeon]|nr:2-oxoacid:acceptor oxidoreductase family protein [Candidatus Aenigmarchaeota archaeon]
MKDIFEIRIHGRGGQGAKTAAQLIVESALVKGKHIQAFPEYGPERSGAPMVTFARISDKPIRTYQPVTNPDVVMVIDPTLLDIVDVTKGLDEQNGVLIVNTPKSPEKIKEKTGFKGRTCTVDATGISIDLLGVNMPNTPILGALIKATEILEIKDIEEKIRERFLKKIGEEKTNANIQCVRRAYNEVKES